MPFALIVYRKVFMITHSHQLAVRASDSLQTRSTELETINTDPNSPRYDERPWGSFTVLDEGAGYKVKRIEVLPGKRLSYQKHAQRAEHWFVTQGTAKVTLDGQEFLLQPGEYLDIAIGAAHRVENPGEETVIFIEVQRGSYLGEDDIVRLQDDFGRIQG
jgi:mannose-6-phosphate isomerase